jgi:hypothetical protein
MANHTAKVYRLLPAAAAALVMLIPAGETASATSASDNPFRDAVQVADAQLDTMRGGFEFSSGQHVNFGLNVEFTSYERVNGVGQGPGSSPIVGTFSVSNGLDKSNDITVTTTGNVSIGPVGSIIGSNLTKVTTTLTNSGIVTVIQNTNPNTTLQTQQLLSVQTQGLVHNAIRGGTVLIRPITIFH